ncbi:unnamed protein product [Ectocarpus sp. CCAP 1310/34]|nr:unnamed protein product [Ectocarpus sp. CCAP 1310/34]
MSKVNVNTNGCATCGIHGLASDNWRETGLFNYNNSYLVELSILYRCLETFTRGTTKSAFFETFLEPLASDLVWSKANPDLAKDKIDPVFEVGLLVTASRPEHDVNTDLVMNLLQLSIVSPAWFGGRRVQLVVGAGETVGNAPAWVSPDIRLSEIFHKTQRGVMQGRNNTAFVEQGNGSLLIGRLEGKAIGDLSGMDVATLRGHMKACWPDGGFQGTKESMLSILQQLHSFWESDDNPNRGSCSKHFVSRERVVSEGVTGVFTPNKVMVIHKVLRTAESAVDMSDCVGACQVLVLWGTKECRGCYMTEPKDLVLESVTA